MMIYRKALNKQRVLNNSLLQAGYFCTACNKDPFASYFKSSSIIYTDILGKVIYNFYKKCNLFAISLLGSSLKGTFSALGEPKHHPH